MVADENCAGIAARETLKLLGVDQDFGVSIMLNKVRINTQAHCAMQPSTGRKPGSAIFSLLLRAECASAWRFRSRAYGVLPSRVRVVHHRVSEGADRSLTGPISVTAERGS
eukprot:461179-Pyramimonas_sp.AAC.2